MINSNELRLGNLFIDIEGKGYCNPGSIQRVDNIDTDGVNRWDDMGALGCCPFDKMGPILLTPEILGKCGFKYNGYGYEPKDPSNGFEGINDRGDGEYILSINDGEYTTGTGFKYFHQLQNLYFALTGIELNVNL